MCSTLEQPFNVFVLFVIQMRSLMQHQPQCGTQTSRQAGCSRPVMSPPACALPQSSMHAHASGKCIRDMRSVSQQSRFAAWWSYQLCIASPVQAAVHQPCPAAGAAAAGVSPASFAWCVWAKWVPGTHTHKSSTDVCQGVQFEKVVLGDRVLFEIYISSSATALLHVTQHRNAITGHATSLVEHLQQLQ